MIMYRHVCCTSSSFPSVSFCPCELQAPVTMEGSKISIQFPQYHFTAEIIDDKLVMVREITYSHKPKLKPMPPSIQYFHHFSFKGLQGSILAVIGQDPGYTQDKSGVCYILNLNLFFSLPVELHNSRREGCDIQQS